MEKQIRFCYRKIIDINAATTWEKLVHDDTYIEFKMQFQYYNQDRRLNTFAELIHQIPAAEKLHGLVSAAAVNYLRQLNGKIPDIKNALGLTFLPFENFRFEIIQSDMRDKAKHIVAINFYSDLLTWHSTIGNQLVLSSGKMENGELLTYMLTMQPFLSIYSIK